MNKKELTPIFDRCQSFYGKAHIFQDDNTIILKSYNTNILQLDTKTKKVKFLTNNKNHFTQTTNRHINEFLRQYTNETTKTKNELIKLANAE